MGIGHVNRRKFVGGSPLVAGHEARSRSIEGVDVRLKAGNKFSAKKMQPLKFFTGSLVKMMGISKVT